MMIRGISYIFIIIIISIANSSYGQRAYDGECIIGFEGRIATFSDGGQPILSVPNNDVYLYSHGSSSIADKNGKLAIACSGVTLVNRLGFPIVDSGLNYDVGTRKFSDWTSGWPTWTQQSIILPKTTYEYYVFTYTMSDNAYDDWVSNTFFRTDMLTYHVVDMKENNGQGKVILKNQILMKDAVLSSNRMTAVKHGNGKDWWLVAPHQKEHIFYLFLVTANGISGPFEKSVDYPVIDSFFGGQFGQSSFNRIGDKYAYTTYTTGGVFVLNFDRCTGEFSKYYYYAIPSDTNLNFDFPIGNQFSPNDSLLYVNTSNNIFQIDINDTSVNSLQFIYGPDVDSANEYNQQYMNLYMGGDDRLYINNKQGVKSTMSYIEYPNKRGLASGFCRRCLKLPISNAYGLPNMPYYHLGKKEGSMCDTIPIAPIWETIRLYPNPVSGILNVYLPLAENTAISLGLYNVMGQKVFSSNEEINALQQFTVDMNALAKGIYILRIESEGSVWKEKVVKE